VLTVAATGHVWDSETGAPIATLDQKTPAHVLLGGRFSPDGKKIVTASSDHTACIWNSDSAETIAILNHDQTVLAGHSGEVLNADFSRDGRLVLTNAKDGTARVWATRPMRAVVLRAKGHSVESTAFSPDSRRVVTASWDETARIWDVETGEQTEVLKGHSDSLLGAIFSADGQLVLTASDDKTARIWNSETAEQIAVFMHDGAVRSARFSLDGRRIVTKVGNGAQIWDRETKQIIATLPPYSTVSRCSRRAITRRISGTAKTATASPS
jgi:WD40 repeat protein